MTQTVDQREVLGASEPPEAMFIRQPSNCWRPTQRRCGRPSADSGSATASTDAAACTGLVPANSGAHRPRASHCRPIFKRECSSFRLGRENTAIKGPIPQRTSRGSCIDQVSLFMPEGTVDNVQASIAGTECAIDSEHMSHAKSSQRWCAGRKTDFGPMVSGKTQFGPVGPIEPSCLEEAVPD